MERLYTNAVIVHVINTHAGSIGNAPIKAKPYYHMWAVGGGRCRFSLYNPQYSLEVLEAPENCLLLN